jgi:hypothetical protein
MLFVEKKVFNPALSGKAVYLKGYDVDGDMVDRLFLVKGVNGEKIILTNSQGNEVDLHMENFSDEGIKLTVLELPQDQPKKTRVVEGRKQRTVEQAKKDSSEVTALLAAKGYALRLETIIKGMRNLGHKHWNNNNGSSFVKQAIKYGAPIKKVERGVYVYDPKQNESPLNDQLAAVGKIIENVKRSKGVSV